MSDRKFKKLVLLFSKHFYTDMNDEFQSRVKVIMNEKK